MENTEVKAKSKKTYIGQVVSDKMDKTIVVSVSTKKLHSLYKKYVSRSKKVKAHDELNDAKMGDTVEVVETKPYSKEKCWRLTRIVERAK